LWAGALLLAEAGLARARAWRAGGRGVRSRSVRSTRSSSSSAVPSPPARPPPAAYWRAGASNALGPALGYLALAYISYPAQVLAKSAKVLPVMAMGTLLGGASYGPAEYGCAAAIGGGVGLFALASAAAGKGGATGKARSHSHARLAAPNAPLGYALCLANLVLDGYTNAAQDAINRAWPGGATALWTMAWMNAWCGAYHGAYLALTGAGARLASFCAAHPAAAADVALFCACGAAGQLFIFFLIRRFGSTTNALVTTTRKFFNILLSVAWLGHPLTGGQWAGVAAAFGGLMASALAGKKRGGHGERAASSEGGSAGHGGTRPAVTATRRAKAA